MDIQRSFAVFTMATILTFLGMLIIWLLENGKLTFLQVFFEVMSAFGTCGLSLGVTSDISDISQGRTNGTHVYRTCWLNIIYHYDSRTSRTR